MRTIQRLTKDASQNGNIISILEISLPQNSKILSLELVLNALDDNYFIIWFEGTTEDNTEFEPHKLGIFKQEEPLPLNAMRFHSRVHFEKHSNMGLLTPLFLYEFICP